MELSLQTLKLCT